MCVYVCVCEPVNECVYTLRVWGIILRENRINRKKNKKTAQKKKKKRKGPSIGRKKKTHDGPCLKSSRIIFRWSDSIRSSNCARSLCISRRNSSRSSARSSSLILFSMGAIPGTSIVAWPFSAVDCVPDRADWLSPPAVNAATRGDVRPCGDAATSSRRRLSFDNISSTAVVMLDSGSAAAAAAAGDDEDRC